MPLSGRASQMRRGNRYRRKRFSCEMHGLLSGLTPFLSKRCFGLHVNANQRTLKQSETSQRKIQRDEASAGNAHFLSEPVPVRCVHLALLLPSSPQLNLNVSLLQPRQAWTREQKDCAENAMKLYFKKTASLLKSLSFFIYLRKYK